MAHSARKHDSPTNIAAPVAGLRRLLSRGLVALVAAHALATQVAEANVYEFTPLAGAASVLDHTNGTGTNARFFNPTAVAVDGAGNAYVADGGDHTIRKVSAGGVVTTLAGNSGQGGSSDGSGSGALFLYPYAVAVDGSGNVYVADSGNNNIRKVTAGGAVTTLAGNAGLTGSSDGTGSAALFNRPQGIAVDASGNVYVGDTDNSTLRKVTASGVVTTLAGSPGQTGSSDGAGSSARFSYPCGVAVDAAGNVYVADFDNSTVRKVTPAGSVTTLAGTAGASGAVDGSGGSARFNHPQGVAVDGAGNVYAIDTSNQTLREISPGGAVSTIAGTPGIGGHADGGGASASFFYPAGVASTAAGVVYVADTGNHLLRVLASPGSVATLAGASGTEGSTNGTGSGALFSYPYGVAIGGSGTLYIADSGNNTIRQANSAGVVQTLAGSPGITGSSDGVGGSAAFSNPAGVAVDSSGNIYVADSGNSTIRKITAGGSVSTLAGQAGVAGSSDGTGSAAHFNAPRGIAVDSSGNVYVADTENDTVRKITSGGTVSTLAGAAGQTGSGDGAGGSARFNAPYAVAVDSGGNVYVADFNNATIRKINTSDTVSTLAGTAGNVGFTDGTGFAASFNQPYAVAVDGSGYVYVADTYNRALRMVSPSGSVVTLNGPETRFYYPQGIAVGSSGTLYVADGDNQAVSSGGAVVAPSGGAPVASQSVTLGQNATFSVSSGDPTITYQWETSVDGGSTWTAVGDNSTFGGATTDTLTVTAPSLSMSGDMFEAELSNSAGSSTSAAATLTVLSGSIGGGPTGSARLTNLSIRSYVGTGASAVTVGFYISGSGSKQMLIRGVGPTLATFGVGGVLANPQLTVFNSGGTVIDADAAWGGGATLAGVFASLGAFALPATSADSAVFLSLATGSYTAQVSGVNGTTGVALAELYDADAGDPPTRLINASARALSSPGSGVLTAGFEIGGSGTDTLLIRGIGPGLTQYGVAGVLAAPQVTVFNSSGASIGANTVWGGGSALAAVFAEVGAFALPAGSADSALVITLPAGAYTVEVSGANGTSGIALVEVYEVN
jgi:sugar lactone lactonase YvrE